LHAKKNIFKITCCVDGIETTGYGCDALHYMKTIKKGNMIV